MTTFYRDSSVEVTSRAIEVGGRSYALRELTTVWHRAGDRQVGRRRFAALVLAPLGPLVAAAGVVAIALRHDGAGATRLALFVVAGLLALSTVPLLDLVLGRVEQSYDRGARVHEIWARWRGREILLVRTGDRQRFGRIYRALSRALERTPTRAPRS